MITVIGEDVYYTDEEDDRDGLSAYDYADRDVLFEAWDCAYGERCCMPGPHTRDECHTAEMAEEWISGEE